MRSKAIAYYGAAARIGSTFGLVAWWLVNECDFLARWFLIKVHFALFLLVLSVINVKGNMLNKQRIDYLGAVLSVIMSIVFVYGMR